MIPAISFNEIQFWVTLVTMILLVTNELISQDLGVSRLYVDRDRFRNVTIFFVALFMLVFALKVYINFMK